MLSTTLHVYSHQVQKMKITNSPVEFVKKKKPKKNIKCNLLCLKLGQLGRYNFKQLEKN